LETQGIRLPFLLIILKATHPENVRENENYEAHQRFFSFSFRLFKSISINASGVKNEFKSLIRFQCEKNDGELVLRKADKKLIFAMATIRAMLIDTIRICFLLNSK
jgi:hypothetical protein